MNAFCFKGGDGFTILKKIWFFFIIRLVSHYGKHSCVTNVPMAPCTTTKLLLYTHMTSGTDQTFEQLCVNIQISTGMGAQVI